MYVGNALISTNNHFLWKCKELNPSSSEYVTYCAVDQFVYKDYWTILLRPWGGPCVNAVRQKEITAWTIMCKGKYCTSQKINHTK